MAIQPGWGKQWETLANAIHSYYGGGSGYEQYEKVADMLSSGNYTMEEMESILGQIPEFERTYNANGELIRVGYKTTANATTSSAGSVAQQVNSNVNNATQTQFSTTQTITKDAQTGKVAISDNLIKYKTGQLAPTTMKSIPISALQGLMAASAGITIGKTISQAAYDHGFNWLSWAGVEMQDLNPQMWATITEGDDSLAAKAFNMILGLDENNNPQPYMTQETLAYMIAYMGAVGALDNPVHNIPQHQTTGEYTISSRLTPLELLEMYSYNTRGIDYSAVYSDIVDFQNNYWTDDKIAFISFFNENTNYDGWSPIRIYITKDDYADNITLGYSAPCYEFQTKGAGLSGSPIVITECLVTNGNQPLYVGAVLGLENDFSGIDITTTGGVIGIYDQAGATTFDPTGISDWSDINAVLNALKAQYPELWENRVEMSPDGETTVTYIPVGFPTGGVGQNPTTIGATQSQLAPDITGDGENATDELIKTLIEAITHPQSKVDMEDDTDTPVAPIDPNGDPRGTGENPPIVPPIGSASALWKIYNPSQSQLNTFGAWLWSSNFVDQLLKLFNDPMQAIIGLHKVYCTPPISGSGPIKVGYLVSDASANYVSNQYTEIDCGDVDMKEHFNNAFDYDEFTRVSIFLPFIGFKDLDVKDIMRSTINVKYGVDVLTGACLAKITVTRDLNSPILYTFAGNCAVQYPVSSGSYIGIITGLCSLLGGVAGTLATGGALAPALVGATAGLPRMHANVEHSGSISSNAGALGPKKPYLVIQRPQTHMPLNGILIEGESQNESVVLGSLNGYVKVKKADLMGIPATGSELDEIRDLLEQGIYMS